LTELSLGFFHWRGLGRFSVDRGEGVRLWRLGGLEIRDSALIDSPAVSVQSSDSTAGSSRFCVSSAETQDPGTDRQMKDGLELIADDAISGLSSRIGESLSERLGLFPVLSQPTVHHSISFPCRLDGEGSGLANRCPCRLAQTEPQFAAWEPDSRSIETAITPPDSSTYTSVCLLIDSAQFLC
jgi:hypothetical protein